LWEFSKKGWISKRSGFDRSPPPCPGRCSVTSRSGNPPAFREVVDPQSHPAPNTCTLYFLRARSSGHTHKLTQHRTSPMIERNWCTPRVTTTAYLNLEGITWSKPAALWPQHPSASAPGRDPCIRIHVGQRCWWLRPQIFRDRPSAHTLSGSRAGPVGIDQGIVLTGDRRLFEYGVLWWD